MAIRQKCLYCGEPVSASGYCTSCKLSQSFLKKAVNTSAYHYNVGLERAKARDLTGAEESLKTSLRYNKMNIRSRNLLGLIYYETGEVVPALSQWVMSVNYQPEKNPAVRYLKELRDDPKELERASEVARQFNQALEHAKQHSFDLALIPLRKALSLNINFVKGHLLMALIYTQMNRKGVAKKHLSKVLSIDRNNVRAQRILREMGEKEESITRLAEQGDDVAEELFSYYGVETPDGSRPARKIDPVSPVGKRSSRMKRFKEASKAKVSNVYMLVGVLIGVLILFFLLRPGIKRSAEDDANAQETSYLKELSARNAEIAGLQLSVDEANKKVEQVKREKDALDNKVTSLNAQIEALRAQIAAGGAAILPEKTTEEKTEDSTAETTFDESLQGDAQDQTIADGGEGGQGETGDGTTPRRGITASEIEAMAEQE